MEAMPVMKTSRQVENWLKLIFMHLFPGLLITLGYILMVRFLHSYGYPKAVVLGIVCIIVLVPVELGYVLYRTKKSHGKVSLNKITPFNNKLKLKEYAMFIPLLFVWAGIAFALTQGTGTYLLNNFFKWMPDWYIINDNLLSYSKNMLIVTFLSTFLLTGIMAPIVEEIYFRGFLLPRMNWLGRYAPLVSTILFALYHFWSPWQAITRIIAMLPMCYYVNHKKSIYPGIIVHCLINIAGDAVGVLLLVLK